MPAISISVFTLAIVMRMVRATMLEVLNLDYVRTARAKGVPRRRVLRKHALRNALIPVVTVVGFEVGVLIGGAAIVEIIFGLPGRRLHAAERDLQPRLPGDPGRDADHRRGLRRRRTWSSTCSTASSTRGSASRERGERAPPGLGGASRAAGWIPRALAQPDRHRRRGHRRLLRPHGALRPLHLDARPERARSPTGCSARAGRTRSAPTTSAATRSRGSSTARRSRCRSARVAISIALVVGHADRPARRLLRRHRRPAADARRRHHVRVPGPRARDRDRRPARREPAQRDDRDRHHHHPRVRARRARRGARGDGLPVHRVGARARRRRPAGSWCATCSRTSSRR